MGQQLVWQQLVGQQPVGVYLHFEHLSFGFVVVPCAWVSDRKPSAASLAPNEDGFRALLDRIHNHTLRRHWTKPTAEPSLPPPAGQNYSEKRSENCSEKRSKNCSEAT